MPNFYNYTQDGLIYSFDDVFVPADAFREGNLWTWGSTFNGALGDFIGINGARCTPVTTFAGGSNWKQVSSSGQVDTSFAITGGHSAAIKTDGTLWVWGDNTSGQLGINSLILRCTPVTTFAGGSNWKQVYCGSRSIAAIKTDGTLWNWGNNASGQIGDNTTTTRCTPVTTFIGGTNWKQVSSAYHTAAIKTDGTLWVWGDNGNGNIGDNTGQNKLTPVTTFLGGTNWKQVSCGPSYTGAIKTDGTLWMWGANGSGELGNNTAVFATDVRTPVTTFAGGSNWKQVSCGGQSTSTTATTAAIKTDGTLWTWGRGTDGKIGDNTTTTRCTPVTTFAGGSNWKQISSGSRSYMSAIKTDGTLWTWGFNSLGGLGTNTINNTICTPVTTFAGGTNWKQVSSGWSHTTALTFDDPTFPT